MVYQFPKRMRLTSSKEFKAVFDTSKQVVVKGYVAYVKPNQLGYPRLGIVIGKRQAKAASTRNLMKRLVRESFRQNQAALDSWDCVIIIKHFATSKVNRELLQWLELLWCKLQSFPINSSSK